MGDEAEVKYNEDQYNISKDAILKSLKALVASDIWSLTEYFKIVNEGDVVLQKALKVLADGKEYNRILGYK